MRTLPTKVLWAADGSREAALASRAAVDLCRGMGAQLHVVHAWTNVLPEAYAALSLDNHSDVFEREGRGCWRGRRRESEAVGRPSGGRT